MALQTSGAISFNDIQVELDGVNPISMTEYYGIDTLPASGQISMSDFYGVSASPLPITDTFTDTNGVLIEDHTPDANPSGNPWVIYAGGYDIQGNLAEATAGFSIAGIDSTVSDNVKVEALGVGDFTRLITRLSDALNYWGGRDTGQLVEFNAGTLTVRAENGSAATPPRALILECVGSTITFKDGAGASVSYISTFNQTATIHGIKSRFSGESEMDNFSVTEL